MSLAIAGQLAGLGVACGLNLYLTVAALGLFARVGALPLPAGLQGLEGWIVITSALALYAVEAVIDRIHHADSLWDTVHTFIRPPGAALLAIAALWGQPARVMTAGAILTLVVALAAHGAKAGLRMTLNAIRHTRWQTWISTGEDVLAVAVAVLALLYPTPVLAVVAAAALLAAPFGPRLFRALRLGMRAVVAWIRSIFARGRWREFDALPDYVRTLVGDSPLGAAPPRGARATLHGLDQAGPFRNGWLVLTPDGPGFAFRTPFGTRRVPLPTPREIRHENGVWADVLHITAEVDATYTLFLFKDGPKTDLAIQDLNPAIP